MVLEWGYNRKGANQMELQLVQRPPVEQLNFDGTLFYPTTDVEQLNFDGTPLYRKPELSVELEEQVEPEKQSLAESIGGAALYGVSLAQVKVKIADTVDHLKQEGGKIVAHAALAGLAIAGAAGLNVMESGHAEAQATTCISETDGFLCTTVFGRGVHVDSVLTERVKLGVSPVIYKTLCNYSAWFYYSPPEGGAYGLGYQRRQGCDLGSGWFEQNVNRNFEPGTQVCAKVYENFNQDLVGEKCVGISAPGEVWA